ncbi:MAG: hypothetical protein EOO77_13070 [Oxalobacteraceae bacterium]|nr:MAG: hypothetical protein EOO77_13070 [Oxalobacteraceae bacterium]
MNKVHAAIVRRIRESSKAVGHKLSHYLEPLTDEQVVRLMFSNYRGKGTNARGLRLTNSGLQMMLGYFTHYEVNLPQGRHIQTGELLYLDRRAKLPYYCSDQKLVVFETELGMKLKLYNGDIGALITIESY